MLRRSCLVVLCLLGAMAWNGCTQGQGSRPAPEPAPRDAKPVKLIQQTPKCADFDVLIDNSPAFRALLPEIIRAGGLNYQGGTHMTPGDWKEVTNGLEGTFKVSDELEVATTVLKGAGEIQATIRIKNLTGQELTDLRADICSALNHLPGAPGWANQAFFAGVDLDRDVQGRMWYEKISPKNLFALTKDGWVPMHPKPDAPSAQGIPQYDFKPSKTPAAIGCAVRSPDGKSYFFQMWDTDCYYLAPVVGNACMHLVPVVAAKLAPGASAEIHATIGFFEGTQDQLAGRMKQFRATRAK